MNFETQGRLCKHNKTSKNVKISKTANWVSRYWRQTYSCLEVGRRLTVSQCKWHTCIIEQKGDYAYQWIILQISVYLCNALSCILVIFYNIRSKESKHRCAIILIDIGLVSVTTPVISLLLYLVILFLIFVNKLVLQTQQNTLLKTTVLIYYSMRYDWIWIKDTRFFILGPNAKLVQNKKLYCVQLKVLSDIPH